MDGDAENIYRTKDSDPKSLHDACQLIKLFGRYVSHIGAHKTLPTRVKTAAMGYVKMAVANYKGQS